MPATRRRIRRFVPANGILGRETPPWGPVVTAVTADVPAVTIRAVAGTDVHGVVRGASPPASRVAARRAVATIVRVGP